MTDYLPLAIQLLTWFSLLYLSVLLNVSYAAANFTINGFSPSQGQVQGVVGPDGTAWLTLQTAELKATPVTLTLTKFRDKRSESIVVGFQKDNGENGDLDILKTIVTQRKATINGRYTIKLDASAAIAGRAYGGEISVATSDKTIEVFPILLKREVVLPIIYQTVPTKAREVNVNVPVSGVTSIQFDAGSDEYLGKLASFELGTFVNETDGRVADVYFKDATRTDDKITELRVPLDELRHRFNLDASEIPIVSTYVGELIVSIDERLFPPTTIKFTRLATV
ncbi:MAG: hypothetical protein QNK19_11615, partial [Xanthomonadales bacterium]|nr:hypothetical protein [Xanthomonadales bacterium]